MQKREKYKRLVRFFLSLVNVAILTGIYAWFWFSYYHERDIIGILYFKWGHYAILTLYAFLVYFFGQVYGAMKVGYLRVMDILFSQFIAVFFVNGITYIQLALIGHWTFGKHALPLVWMTGLDLAAVVLWVLFARWFYALIYPPREILLIYGDRSPASIIAKISTRRDKYRIRETACIESESDEEICRKIDKYRAVVIGDIPAQRRNDFLKYCFKNNIRCYTVPKISDIMLKNSETINLFDTALQLCRNRGLSAEQQALKRLMDLIIDTIEQQRQPATGAGGRIKDFFRSLLGG